VRGREEEGAADVAFEKYKEESFGKIALVSIFTFTT